MSSVVLIRFSEMHLRSPELVLRCSQMALRSSEGFQDQLIWSQGYPRWICMLQSEFKVIQTEFTVLQNDFAIIRSCFVLYHVPEFHQDCLSAFFSYFDLKIPIYKAKIEKTFWGFVKNYLYHLSIPKSVKTAPGIFKKSQKISGKSKYF